MNNVERFLVFICVLAILLGLKVIVQKWKVRLALRRYDARTVPIVGRIVQANHHLWVPGEGDYPAMVLVSFDPEFQQRPEILDELASRISRLKNTQATDPVDKWISDLVTDEQYRPSSRDRLLKPFTGGYEIYSAHVMVIREFLPEGRLTDPYIYCRGIPGDEGPIWMIVPPGMDEGGEQ